MKFPRKFLGGRGDFFFLLGLGLRVEQLSTGLLKKLGRGLCTSWRREVEVTWIVWPCFLFFFRTRQCEANLTGEYVLLGSQYAKWRYVTKKRSPAGVSPTTTYRTSSGWGISKSDGHDIFFCVFLFRKFPSVVS